VFALLFFRLSNLQNFPKGIGLFSTTSKINAYCINKFTKMLPAELIHIF